MYTNLPCKTVRMLMTIHMKNVNDIDFDTNINHDMCMKVMLLFIDIKLHIIDKYVCLSISCVLLSAYEYVNVCVDVYVNEYDI